MKSSNPIITSVNAAKSSRRQALKGLSLGTLGLAAINLATRKANAGPLRTIPESDAQILAFALNLEYLEAEYYTYATTGSGIEAQGLEVGGTGNPGSVIIKENPQVPFGSPAIQQYALEIAADERAHVNFIRKVLAGTQHQPPARPMIDLMNSFSIAAQAAGIVGAGETFDPFANDFTFLLGAFIFEDLGVTAYRGAVPFFVNKTILSSAAGILGTEAYHAGNIRAKLYEFGGGAVDAAQRISDLRDALDGGFNLDEGVVKDGAANIVPADQNGMVFARSMRQVLNIVYEGVDTMQGGFFPNRING